MKKLWAYLKTKDFRIHFLGAIGTVIAIVLIAFFSLGYYTDHGEAVPVPALKGLSIDRAVSTLQSQGFRFQVDSVYVLDKEPGTVIEQDPDAGTSVKANRTIYLTIVKGVAPPVTLPNLEESNYRSAAASLSNVGLKVGDTTYRSDIARDRVLEVRLSGKILKAGDRIPKGSRLDLVLGDGAGASEVEIPDLLKQDLDAAKFAIRGASLTLGVVNYRGTITDSSNLVVVSQFPMRSDSSSKAAIGSRINLTVEQGKKTNDQQQQPPQQ